jgi:hypothetical protein
MNQNQDPNEQGRQQQDRQPQQSQQERPQNAAGQQNQVGQEERRIDTDGDGRTRDPNDTRPNDQGGQGQPVQR